MNINFFMQEAINQAQIALKNNEVPIGGILVDNVTNNIITKNHNQINANNNAIFHCELCIINDACKKLNSKYLNSTTLFITLEPCTMCAAAISMARIRRLYYGASDLKSGGIENGVKFFSHPSCHHRPEVYGGIDELRAQKLLKTFFKSKR